MDNKYLSQHRFGQFAQGYVHSQDHAVKSDLERLVEVAGPQPGWVALDIATGGGHTALHFAPYVDRVIASDLTLKMLQTAREFITGKGASNVHFNVAEAENLPFGEGRFDLVTCRIAPHHFNDCARFVQEARRCLRPGGRLLVQDHVLPEDGQAAEYVERFEKLRDPSHQRACSEKEWVQMFQTAGLRVEHIERIAKRHKFTPWVERQGCPSQVIERLEAMLRQAPSPAASWMQPQALGTPEASFANQHILIAGWRI